MEGSTHQESPRVNSQRILHSALGNAEHETDGFPANVPQPSVISSTKRSPQHSFPGAAHQAAQQAAQHAANVVQIVGEAAEGAAHIAHLAEAEAEKDILVGCCTMYMVLERICNAMTTIQDWEIEVSDSLDKSCCLRNFGRPKEGSIFAWPLNFFCLIRSDFKQIRSGPFSSSFYTTESTKSAKSSQKNTVNDEVETKVYKQFPPLSSLIPLFFWVIYSSLLIVEPFLCAYDYRKRDDILTAQKSILVVSSVMYVINFFGEVRRYRKRRRHQEISAALEKQRELEAERASLKSRKGVSDAHDHIPDSFMSLLSRTTLYWETFFEIVYSGAFVYEGSCLACGWAFLYHRPGIAALRCFRLFRIFWYKPTESWMEPFAMALYSRFGINVAKLPGLVLRCFRFAAAVLTNLGTEMFFLTERTRGGFILMLILFYSSYVIGTMLWQETSYLFDETSPCFTLPSCTYTMMRLTLFDGTAFDYLYAVAVNHQFIFAICVVYMCATSFGVFNGLIGIFANLIDAQSNDKFGQFEIVKREKQAEKRVFKPVEPEEPTVASLSVDIANVKSDLARLSGEMIQTDHKIQEILELLRDMNHQQHKKGGGIPGLGFLGLGQAI